MMETSGLVLPIFSLFDSNRFCVTRGSGALRCNKLRLVSLFQHKRQHWASQASTRPIPKDAPDQNSLCVGEAFLAEIS